MFKKSISWYLVIAMFIIGIAPRVDASFTPSQAMAIELADRQVDLQKIQATLETKVVKHRLQALGFSGEEIQNRLSQLSDQQLHNYAQQLDDLRPGGDTLGVIIGVLVIIALVLVILHFTGHKVTVE